MGEWGQWLAKTLSLLSVTIFASLYMIGGRKWKWVRRIGGSLLLGITIILLSLWQGCFSYLYFAYPVLLFTALSLGYGSDTFLGKCRRRFIYGLCLGLTSLVIAFPNGSWVLFGMQLGLAIVSSMILGVLNPANSAVDEEGLIAICSTLFVPFMLTYRGQ